MSLSRGHKLAHYEILEPIGKGGMGEVYRARDTKLGRDVAIKYVVDLDNFGRPYDVAPDGQRFLMMKRVDSAPRRNIHIVLNWDEELERFVPTTN
jgi:serine/threonine protein kinase